MNFSIIILTKYLDKLKTIVNEYLQITNKVIMNLKESDFLTTIEEVSTYFEFILSDEFEEENIRNLQNKRATYKISKYDRLFSLLCKLLSARNEKYSYKFHREKRIYSSKS